MFTRDTIIFGSEHLPDAMTATVAPMRGHAVFAGLSARSRGRFEQVRLIPVLPGRKDRVS